MRINQANRFLMNEADGSPGGGAAPAVPAEPPAAPAAPAPVAVTVDQVKSLMTEMLTGFKNATFAELRKAGALGKEKSSPDPTAAPSPQSPAAAAVASPTLSLADVEAMLEQQRVVTRAAVEHKLTDAQVKRMNSALKADRPDDIATWTGTYLTDMGLVKQPDTQPSTPVTPASAPQPSGAPISDKGSPAPGSGSNWHREFADNPLGMSAAAITAMNVELGVEVARKKRIEAVNARGSQIRVTTR